MSGTGDEVAAAIDRVLGGAGPAGWTEQQWAAHYWKCLGNELETLRNLYERGDPVAVLIRLPVAVSLSNQHRRSAKEAADLKRREAEQAEEDTTNA